MKEYRVSLEVATSLAVTGCEVADVLGVPRSALAEERVKRGLVWRCEPSGGQTGRLEDRIGQLTAEICPRRTLPHGGGFRRVSLGIDVRYDSASCTVHVPLYSLVHWSKSLAKRIPELSSVEFRCSLSDEDLPAGQDFHYDSDYTWEEWRKMGEGWEVAGRPRPPRAASPLMFDQSRRRSGRGETIEDANEYIVSLDAIASEGITASEVADVLGLPPEALTSRGIRNMEGVLWSCEVVADETVGLAEQIRFLASRVHPRRRYEQDDEIEWVYLNIGVFYDGPTSEPCLVRLPLSGLVSLLARRLLVHYVEVSCYPGDRGVPSPG